MRIGVDASCWGNRRGFGRFTRELFFALLELDKSNDYVFFVDSEMSDAYDIPSGVEKIVAKTQQAQIEAASAGGRRTLQDIWSMTREVLRHRVDVFFFPAVYSYFPILNRTKIVLTIHDVIADHHPELVFPDRRSKYFWKLKQNLAIKQANVIATVSEHSKNEIADYFRINESKIRVIPEAASSVFQKIPQDRMFFSTLSKHGLTPEQRFLLYVGGISPHKNLGTLIDAFKLILDRDSNHDIKLVLVGDYTDDPFYSAYPTLKKQIDDLELQGSVLFTGFITDEDLVCLYNSATLLVFPSLEEGFGLPAIEAMACGTPIAASTYGSLPEIVAGAGRFFDPTSAAGMADVIGDVLSNESVRAEMIRSGMERSKEFCWKKAADETLGIFNSLGPR